MIQNSNIVVIIELNTRKNTCLETSIINVTTTFFFSLLALKNRN